MPKVVPGYKAEARARILEAARGLFVTRGFQRTTMGDVADQLGVSKAALYQYYRSKADLLREIQVENRRMARRWLNDALEAADPASGFADTFESAFRKAINKDQIALYFELLGAASHDDEIRDAIRFDYREDLKNLRHFLGELRRRRLLASAADPDVLAFTITALFQAAVWDLAIGLDSPRTYELLRKAIADVLRLPPDAPPARDATRRRR
jgi:AcrR family transcriptional regulator